MMRGGPYASDGRALAGAREGHEAAFLTLVARYHYSMVHLAETFVHGRAIAEEVTREAWKDVLAGSATLRGRSSIKCWMFQILVERARLRAAQDASSVSPSISQAKDDTSAQLPFVGTFFDDSHPVWPGWWMQSPRAWPDQPETTAAREEALHALRSLPPAQQRVMMLQDVEGWTSNEVCETMQLSAVEQRALLHRARTTVRARLEAYFRFAAR